MLPLRLILSACHCFYVEFGISTFLDKSTNECDISHISNSVRIQVGMISSGVTNRNTNNLSTPVENAPKMSLKFLIWMNHAIAICTRESFFNSFSEFCCKTIIQLEHMKLPCNACKFTFFSLWILDFFVRYLTFANGNKHKYFVKQYAVVSFHSHMTFPWDASRWVQLFGILWNFLLRTKRKR